MTQVQKQREQQQLHKAAAFESFKRSVEEAELEARYNEAMFKKMDFYIRASEITPKFLEVREAENEKYMAAQKEQEAELTRIMEKSAEKEPLIIAEA